MVEIWCVLVAMDGILRTCFSIVYSIEVTFLDDHVSMLLTLVEYFC